MIPFKIHPQAEREIDSAATWYDRERPGFGASFVRHVQSAVERARRMPHAGSLIADVRAHAATVRRFHCERFPYAVIAIVRDHQLDVIAVAHERRKPGYWRRRLAKVLR